MAHDKREFYDVLRRLIPYSAVLPDDLKADIAVEAL